MRSYRCVMSGSAVPVTIAFSCMLRRSPLSSCTAHEIYFQRTKRERVYTAIRPADNNVSRFKYDPGASGKSENEAENQPPTAENPPKNPRKINASVKIYSDK